MCRLRREGDRDGKNCDELFEFARLNVQAGVMASDPDPMASLMMLMLIEMLGRIEALEGQIQRQLDLF